MKYFIRISVALLIMAAAMPIKGQEWEIRYVEADELKGTDADSVMVYSTDQWMALVSITQNYVCIISKEGIFNSGSMGQSLAKVGLYDTGAHLEEKFNTSATIDKSRTYAYITNYRAKLFDSSSPDNFRGTLLKDYLTTNEGYVRILLQRWHDSDLDVRIPCVKSADVIN